MWIPLSLHSHFSLLKALSQPEQIANRLVECGYEGGALMDFGSISGYPSFQKALKKKKLKAIAGCKFSFNGIGSLCLLAKNYQGWKELIKCVNKANLKPPLEIEDVSCYKNFIIFSDIHDGLFKNPPHSVPSLAQMKEVVWDDWRKRLVDKANYCKELFGKENFFLQISRNHHPYAEGLNMALRWVATETGSNCVAASGCFYPHKDSATDHRILLCSDLETRLTELSRKVKVGDEIFLDSNKFGIPGKEELACFSSQELQNSLDIANRCESYEIGSRPMLPKFGDNPDYQLRDLCREGWNKLQKIPKDKIQVYVDRVKNELSVIGEAGLSSYFLIVHDYVRYAIDNLRILVGEGRGSAAGCLVSFLAGITEVDPIEHDLLFERFYNAGRNTKDKVALPDIDVDFPVKFRDKIFTYIRDKYGADKVCQMATFGRMQGRGALKDVLRAHGSCSFEEMNNITEFIPDEAAIADDLQDMQDETGDSSIIRWALENNIKELSPWCVLNKKGSCEGALAIEFEQAIRLEGTKRSLGKHASGLIIASESLVNNVPMVLDNSAIPQPMVGVDMRDAEEMGLVKFDILGTAVLDKIMDVQSLIRTGAC